MKEINKSILIFMAILIITTLLFNILVIKADSLIDLVSLRIALKLQEDENENLLEMFTRLHNEKLEEQKKKRYQQVPYTYPETEEYEWGNI